MDHVLRGNDKDTTNVLKEQRIRTNRGTIQLVPTSECGLVIEEDARKTLGRMLIKKNEEVDRLTASAVEKNKTIVELTEERKTMKAHTAELETQVPSDERNLPVADSRDLQEEDTKKVTIIDDKTVSMEGEKKTEKGRAPK